MLDHETTPTLRFGILATRVRGGELASSGREEEERALLTARAVIELNVEDVDDEAPSFQGRNYSFSVGEGEPPGTQVSHGRHGVMPTVDWFTLSELA